MMEQKARTIIITLETDSKEPLKILKDDLETEISACWNTFSLKCIKEERKKSNGKTNRKNEADTKTTRFHWWD